MFKIHSEFKPGGDQPAAIKKLVNGIENEEKHQVLLGATGTGKTFTIANVIEQVQKPTLILAHNKTLAGQLYAELKDLFPNNRVEYFVSYYDYYQPEAYVPSSDTFIEKDSSINDEIDELRHAATAALLKRKDTIVVASVSCIYGIGEVEEYLKKILSLSKGDIIPRREIIDKLIEMQYDRNNYDLKRGTFRVKGDVIEIISNEERKHGYMISMFDDEIEQIMEIDPVTGVVLREKNTITIFPASHFVTSDEKLKKAIENIEAELEEQLAYFKSQDKLIEHQRLKERTNYDLEMLKETGICRGIENYSRHIALRGAGETPTTLMDFFTDDYLLVVDESHVTLPQVRGMYNGDQARKQTLVDYGFRLPSAKDNRPLRFDEFNEKINQALYISATPGDYELELVDNKFVEQIIRPTGLLDPTIDVRPSKNQIDDILTEIHHRIANKERTLITTLTIRMAEELTNFLKKQDIKVAYLHSEVKTLERLSIVRDLRAGKYDVLVGINLLREGLDIPEVSLICIIDADKEGFLRSDRSLIQTIGRAARNANGHVILYADQMTKSMKKAIEETTRRREIQIAYNKEHNITPQTIQKAIKEVVTSSTAVTAETKISKKEQDKIVAVIEKEMQSAAKNMDYERAIELRNILFEMKSD